VIFEKPIALWGEDWRKIKEIGEKSATKFVVNTQLHFHARNLELKRDVAEGRIGEVRFIDVSARSTPLDQGVHVLELAHSYNGFSPFTGVFGNVSGAKALTSRQPAPDMAEAYINFANGVHAQLVTGLCAPIACAKHSNVVYYHKRIALYGSRGFVHWTMWSWERLTDKGYECGEHDYRVEDDFAQARLTEACFDWLLDAKKPHPTRLEVNLAQFNAILGIYASALRCAPIPLPLDPPDGLFEALRGRLA
jgi:predicted dehydrogenase